MHFPNSNMRQDTVRTLENRMSQEAFVYRSNEAMYKTTLQLSENQQEVRIRQEALNKEVEDLLVLLFLMKLIDKT